MNNNDRRIQRTKRDFKKAYIELLNTYSINDITVKEIVYHANYNRSTFYTHYLDKVQLINEIIDDSIKGVLNSIQITYSKKTVYDFDKLNASIFIMYEYIFKNQMLYKILFDSEKFPTFQESFTKSIQKILIEDSKILDFKDSNLDFEFWTYIQASSVVSRIRYWVHHDFQFTKEYLSEQTLKQIQFKSTKFLFEIAQNFKSCQ